MAHIEEGVLQAYLDDEVAARAEIDAHVHECGTCAAELDRLRQASSLFASAMQASDVQAPVLAAFATVKRAKATTVAPRTWGQRIPLARAAMLLFGFAAAASATIPGSPVRAWISDSLRDEDVPEQEQPAAPVVSDSPASAVAVDQDGDAAALSIEPADGRIRIILTSVSSTANVRIRMVEGERALVQATGNAANARFVTGPGRIELIGVSGGDVVIDMPLSAPDASVVADGKVLYSSE